MKPPKPSPSYAALYPELCEAVRPLGYALAIHGSMTRDMDMIAIPWLKDAAEPEAVVEAIRDAIGGFTGWDTRPGFEQAHGRRSWLIWFHGANGVPIGDAYIDLSVMPRK